MYAVYGSFIATRSPPAPGLLADVAKCSLYQDFLNQCTMSINIDQNCLNHEMSPACVKSLLKGVVIFLIFTGRAVSTCRRGGAKNVRGFLRGGKTFSRDQRGGHIFFKGQKRGCNFFSKQCHRHHICTWNAPLFIHRQTPLSP